jgi:hypothetical protein
MRNAISVIQYDRSLLGGPGIAQFQRQGGVVRERRRHVHNGIIEPGCTLSPTDDQCASWSALTDERKYHHRPDRKRLLQMHNVSALRCVADQNRLTGGESDAARVFSTG